MEKPLPLPNNQVDLTMLRAECQEYIDSIADGSYHEDSDIEHYLFEAALEAIYGKDIFNYINENT
jgi:hypothetical protein